MRLHTASFCLLLVAAGAISVCAQGATPAQSKVAVTPPTKVDDCGCESQKLPEVLAIVNGTRIPKSALSESEKRVGELQQEVVTARKAELDLQINSLLLEAEAKRLGISVGKLLESEVLAKVAEPTEAEALDFYNANKGRLQNEFKDIKSQIVSYLKAERQQVAAKSYADRLRAAAKVTISNLAVTPPATPQERGRVFATVNSTTITSADIEDSLKPLIGNIQDQVYKLRLQSLDMTINDMLLGQEAGKRGITKTALLDTEVKAKRRTVTDAEAQKFYDENKERINGDYAQLKPQILQYLQERADHENEQAFADRLRSGSRIEMFLIEPEAPVYKIAIDDQPMRGNPNATTTFVMFTDYQCPSCAEEHPILERLIAEFGDRVKFVVRDYPLNQHAEAETAAAAAEAARAQGKYWDYVALLYRNQSALQVDKLKEYASQLKLDRAKFDLALASEATKEKVVRDMRDGDKVGVNGTPTIFVNGKMVKDRSYEGLQSVLNASLKAK
jgi:protein-disulfide isomerase